MAASILAKTARDLEMERYGKLYPGYGYEKHKGYPTKEHRAAIAKHGPSPIQRMTFRFTTMGTNPSGQAAGGQKIWVSPPTEPPNCLNSQSLYLPTISDV
jgi:ribonuclease HII